MKLTKEAVIEYYENVMPGLTFDPEVLEVVIQSFDGQPLPTMDTILNRHNDVIDGRTVINGNAVVLSMRSSITELPISHATYKSLLRSCILHMNDINDPDLCSLHTLEFEALAEATGALVASGLLYSDAD